MVDDLVEGRGFGGTSPVVLRLRFVFSYVYCLSMQADSGDQGFGCFGIGEVADGDSDKAAAGAYREMKPAWWKGLPREASCAR